MANVNDGIVKKVQINW